MLALCLPGPGRSETRTVSATGTSALSESHALGQAKRAAVEQGVGVFVTSETEVENFMVVKDEIYSRTEGYIAGYEVQERTQDDGLWTVTILADVQLERLQNDLVALKVLLESMQRPRLGLLIEETCPGCPSEDSALTETELASELTARGFDLVDRAQLMAAAGRDQARKALAGNQEAARALGLMAGADYLLVGKSMIQDAGEIVEGGGLRSAQAAVAVRILSSRTGLYLGSCTSDAAAAHLSPLAGASRAAAKAAKELVEQCAEGAIMASFADWQNNGAPMKLQVTGVTSFSRYKEVVGALEGVEGVASVRKEGWNKAGGMLSLDLRYKGVSEDLAMQLDGLAAGANSLEVEDFGPERVDARLR